MLAGALVAAELAEVQADRAGSRRRQISNREEMPNRSVRWRVVEVGPTNDVITHYRQVFGWIE